MALNKTFTCNTIIDENNNDINCYYQGYHVRTGTWNEVKMSEFNQYSCNLGDGDWLTQTGEVFSGDDVILVFWVSENDDRSGLKDRMCAIKLKLTNESTYINDVQLKPKSIPQCGYDFTPDNPTINNLFVVNSFATDNFIYLYNNLEHFHYRELFNTIIFDSIDVLTLRYDFDEGDGWEDNNTHSYLSIGDYSVSQRVTNAYNLSKICSSGNRVRYNKPIPGLEFEYVDPIHTTENVTINAEITDVDARIVNIKHKIITRNRTTDDIIENYIVDENTQLDYIYDKTIEILQTHHFAQEITWNDGFDDLSFTYKKNLPITNWCPEVSIIKADISDLTKVFKQNSTDLDGFITNWKWKIFFIPPFSDGSYSEVYSYHPNNGNDWEVGFTVGGNYKVQIEVTDDYGCSISDETTFIINAECELKDISNIKFIFPKQLGND